MKKHAGRLPVGVGGHVVQPAPREAGVPHLPPSAPILNRQQRETPVSTHPE